MNADYLMPLPKLVNEATQMEVGVGWENNPLDGFDLYGLMHGYDSAFVRHIFFHGFKMDLKWICSTGMLFSAEKIWISILGLHCRHLGPKLPAKVSCMPKANSNTDK